ncbi:MAG: hypothetical protein IJW18_05675 [Lachnospiraceae bacterium]|nr:hypothetical protein [Lachnospiraceae bacterium]
MRQIIDLAGTWRFQTDVRGDGEADRWYDYNLTDSVEIPGVMQAQGYGVDINEDTCFMSALHDELWYMREEYKVGQKEGMKVPFLSQPPKHYMGKAWYQRDFYVKEDEDLYYVFNIECTKWKTKVWLDDVLIGEDMTLCAPHTFNIGRIRKGEHRLTVCVDNGYLLPYRPDGHGITDSTGATWNGMAGGIYLEARPQIHFGQVNISTDYDTRKAYIKGKINKCVQGQVEVVLEAKGIRTKLLLTDKENDFEMMIPYSLDCEVWDEYEQNLHELKLTLSANFGEALIEDTKVCTFGFRKIEVRDGRFFVNDRETYFRGTHFGGEFPLTGYPSTDVEYWKRIFGICKEWGLNFMRFHSYCPPDAAFVAADELGVYLQVECAMWNHFAKDDDMIKVLKDETKRIIDSFGNHPSFVMLSPSNEPSGDWYEPLMDWVRYAKGLDSHRLYTLQSGWPIPCPSEEITETDYLYYHRSGQGPFGGGTIRGKKGWGGRDYTPSLEGVKHPVICHELGQWCSYPDFDIINKFTGYMRPGNYEVFKARAKQMGVLDKNKEFAYASGRFQVQMYKEDLEANFRTPKIYGFELLDLHDYPGQGTALVGVLDTFWDGKGYIEAKEFRQFCAPTVLLLRMPKAVYTDSEGFSATLELAHFDKKALTDVCVRWQLRERTSKIAYREGSFKHAKLSCGKNIPIGTIEFSFEDVPNNKAYELVAWLELKGATTGYETATVSNYWRLWLYKTDIQMKTTTKNAVYTRSFREAKKALSEGKNVLYMPSLSVLSWECPPLSTAPAFWNNQMGPKWDRGMGLLIDKKHPSLKGFATEEYQEGQWDAIVRNAKGFNLAGFSDEFEPIVYAIDEWNRSYKMGLIWEAKALEGKLLVVSADLENAAKLSKGGTVLFNSLIDYVDSEEFNPAHTVKWEIFEEKFADTLSLKRHDVKLEVVTSEEMEKPITDEDMENLKAGDPGRMFFARKCGYPFEIKFDFGGLKTVKGIDYMPGQYIRTHVGDIKDFEIDAWINDKYITVYKDTAPTSFDVKKIRFSMPVNTDKIVLRVLNGYGKERYHAWTEGKNGWECNRIDFNDQSVCIGGLALDMDDDSWQDMTSNELVMRDTKTITVEIDD